VLSLPSLTKAETQGNAVATAFGCAPTNTACLRALPLSDILALQAQTVSDFGLNPTIDGVFLPIDPAVALATGKYNQVPVFQGTNHDEFRLFTALLFDLTPSGPLTAAEYPAAVDAILSLSGLGGATSEVLAQYPLANYATPDLAYSALTTDAVFSTPAYITDALLAARVPVHAYEFSDENAPEILLPPVSFPYGAAHASELQYIFDYVTGAAPPPYTQAQDALKLTMEGYWTHFATDGVPNASGAPLVPAYNPLLDDMVSLVPPTPVLFDTFATEHKTAFWSALLAAAAAKADPTAQKPAITLDTVRAAVRALRPGARV
jgi:para-nitrobenzyl esterase